MTFSPPWASAAENFHPWAGWQAPSPVFRDIIEVLILVNFYRTKYSLVSSFLESQLLLRISALERAGKLPESYQILWRSWWTFFKYKMGCTTVMRAIFCCREFPPLSELASSLKLLTGLLHPGALIIVQYTCMLSCIHFAVYYYTLWHYFCCTFGCLLLQY